MQGLAPRYFLSSAAKQSGPSPSQNLIWLGLLEKTMSAKASISCRTAANPESSVWSPEVPSLVPTTTAVRILRFAQALSSSSWRSWAKSTLN